MEAVLAALFAVISLALGMLLGMIIKGRELSAEWNKRPQIVEELLDNRQYWIARVNQLANLYDSVRASIDGLNDPTLRIFTDAEMNRIEIQMDHLKRKLPETAASDITSMISTSQNGLREFRAYYKRLGIEADTVLTALRPILDRVNELSWQKDSEQGGAVPTEASV